MFAEQVPFLEKWRSGAASTRHFSRIGQYRGMGRVVVVGGGVIGAACAERLARAGHRVVLLERDRLGAHASGAAAGLLAPHTEAMGGDGAQSLAMFPDLAARLRAETGIDIEYVAGESISPALDDREMATLRDQAVAAGGRWVDAIEARRLEPALHPATWGAAIYAESQVTPPRLTRALAAAAARRGARILEGTPALAIEAGGVRHPNGFEPADVVVLAAGPWSPQLAAPLGIEVAVWPSRGQLVRLRPAAGNPVPLRRMVTHGGRYLVPKPDGTIVAGSTEEAAGFDARVTAEGLETLLGFTRQVAPVLSDATPEWLFAALRPATADGLPIVGAVAEHPGLVLATGHNRNGILLAPITAERVAAAIR